MQCGKEDTISAFQYDGCLRACAEKEETVSYGQPTMMFDWSVTSAQNLHFEKNPLQSQKLQILREKHPPEKMDVQGTYTLACVTLWCHWL